MNPTHAIVPIEPTEAMLRPFYECPPDELRLAWQAMLQIAKVQEERRLLEHALEPQPHTRQEEK